MAGRKSDFTLTKLDDLFSTQEQRDEEKLSKIRDIPLTEIDDFPDHPFKVRDDEDISYAGDSIGRRRVNHRRLFRSNNNVPVSDKSGQALYLQKGQR